MEARMSRQDRAKQFMPFAALKGYEEKLGLVEKLQASRQAIEEIDAEIDELTAECQDSRTAERLKKIKTIIDKELDQ